MNTLFSLGYSGVRFESVAHWLDTHDAVLVDVRYSPGSRNPQWRQPYLQRVLGPRYRWVKALGNVLYRQNGIRLVDPARGVEVVAAMIESNPVVITCMCPDRQVCHRSVAARAISEATGAMVTHLVPADFRPAQQWDLLIPNH